MLLKERVAIVTGGAHGMGRSISQRFADEGCSVAIVDILGGQASNTAAEISKKGGVAIALPCDITNDAKVKAMVDQVVAKYGKVDILVNAAGQAGPNKPTDEYSKEEWDKIINVNLTGPFLCCRYVVPYMKQRKYGRIINFSSVAAIYPKAPRISYASAKSGLLGMTMHMAVDLAPWNILVNAILPGPIRTEFYDGDIPAGTNPEDFYTKVGQTVPLGRMGAPEELASVALFLASDMASYVTGAQIVAGGGEPFRRFQR